LRMSYIRSAPLPGSRERVDELCNRVRRGEHRKVPGAGEQVERRV
jgi:hypothetical protein